MNKKLIVIGIALLFLMVGLSGCTEQLSDNKDPENIESINQEIIISSDRTSGTVPFTVNFYCECKNFSKDIVFYLWDFGDGHNSVTKNPIHLYETAGDFEVTLTVSYVDLFSGEYASNETNTCHSEPYDIEVKHDDFRIFGKIINNFFQDVDVDLAVHDGSYSWHQWEPSVRVNSFSEKDFDIDVKSEFDSYQIMAQWFYPNIDIHGSSMITEAINSNPDYEDLRYYIIIEYDGSLSITDSNKPKTPPKDAVILNHNVKPWPVSGYLGLRDIFVQFYNGYDYPIENVEIEITFYDKSDNIIEPAIYDNRLMSSTLDIIGPSEKAVFYYESWHIPEWYDHYEVELIDFEPINQPYNHYEGLKITNSYFETRQEWDDYLNQYMDRTYNVGSISNTGSSVITFTIYGVFYDSNTRIDSVRDESMTLYSGQKKNFELHALDSDFHKAEYYLDINRD